MIFITGATSGIGKSTAKYFAKRGHDLLLVGRRRDRLDSLKRELESDFRGKVLVARLDVSKREEVEKFAKDFAQELSNVNVLVNNAGLAKGLSLIQEGEIDDWEVMIDTNIKGLLYVTHALLPHLLNQKAAHIVNMGSAASRWPYPKGNVYSATKKAVSALNESLRLDLSGSPIRVTEISPGMVETEFSIVRLGDEEKARSVYKGLDPLTADDIAEAIGWVVERPAHVNIQELVIYPTQQASTTLAFRK